MKDPASKRHHFVPQSYLAFFTKDFSKKSTLYVHNLTDDRAWSSSPKGVAFANDFDRFEAEGHPSDVFEKGVISEIEAEAEAAIRFMSEHKTLPNDKQHLATLYLMGLLASRNPRGRSIRDSTVTRELEIVFSMMAGDKRLFKSVIERARKNGENIPEDISFEKFGDYVEGSSVVAKHSTTGHLDFELPLVDHVTSLLWDRYWSLVVLQDENLEFICSDHPISLRSKHKTRRAYGFKTPNTEVFFPLSTKLAYYGVYENPKSGIIGLSHEGLAIFNSRTRQNALRQVYSRSQSYLIHSDGLPTWVTLSLG